jgi:DNA polymerase III delta prime subunit
MVQQGNVPNLLLVGPSGTGKTTVARAVLEELDADYVLINGSLKGNIDTLRTDISNYASTVSFNGGRKYVILDEADHLTYATQPALRNFMEQFARNCGFVLTANYPNKIIEPLHSRSAVIAFNISKNDAPHLAAQFLKRVTEILNGEKVSFSKDAVVAIINRYFPDWRRMLNELQRYSVVGQIDESVVSRLSDSSIKDLMQALKDKSFTKVRRWASENLNNDQDTLYWLFYNDAYEYFSPQYVPELVLTLAKYQYQGGFSRNPEINFVAAMTEIMVMATWK